MLVVVVSIVVSFLLGRRVLLLIARSLFDKNDESYRLYKFLRRNSTAPLLLARQPKMLHICKRCVLLAIGVVVVVALATIFDVCHGFAATPIQTPISNVANPPR